jgi:hypothetical protein
MFHGFVRLSRPWLTRWFWASFSSRFRNVDLRREKPALYQLATWQLRLLMGRKQKGSIKHAERQRNFYPRIRTRILTTRKRPLQPARVA